MIGFLRVNSQGWISSVGFQRLDSRGGNLLDSGGLTPEVEFGWTIAVNR